MTAQPVRADTSASARDLHDYLLGHRLTAAHPAIHADLVTRLQAGGIRRIGGIFVMPDGSPPGIWLDDQAEVRAAIAREARRARGGGDADAPLLNDDPRQSPLAAAKARQDRAARVTERLARANGEDGDAA